jgi:hypothetical protein
VRRLAALAVMVVLLVGGCGGVDAAASAKGDAELAAIQVPQDWKLTSTTFQPGGLNEPNNHWVRWYNAPTRGGDALRDLDAAVRAAGWTADSSCSPGTGHGCWYKPGYRLTADAGEGSGCRPGDAICALIEVRLSES